MTSSAASGNLARSWARLDGVDLLRALAILLVLMNHVNIRLRIAGVPYTRGLPEQLISSLVWNGQFGVQIFFAVSGFLIASTAIRRWGSLSRVNVRDFYLLRFARIAPLLLSLLAVLSILDLTHLKYFVVSPKTGGLTQALFAALTFRVNVLEARHGYLPANWDILWSLSVEEVFYLFFPLVCRFLGRGKLLVGFLMIVVALGPFGRTALTHGNEVWKEYSYLGGMDAIALGCLTALLVSRNHFSLRVLRTLAVLGAALLIFILCFSVRASAWGLGRNGLDMSILAFGTCAIVVAAAQTRWRAPRVAGLILSLGERSYEVYLTHMFIVFALFELFLRVGKPMAAVPALFVAALVISGLSGVVVARFYSEPMNRRLRKRFGDGPHELGSVLEEPNGTRLAESQRSV
jgi:peptidoglycan/LPS O-acetylase OafA/YrhL